MNQWLKMNQDKPKQSNANPEPAAAIHDQFFLTMSTIKQTLTIPLLTKEASFTYVSRRWVSLSK